jgi:hypothetical protein
MQRHGAIPPDSKRLSTPTRDREQPLVSAAEEVVALEKLFDDDGRAQLPGEQPAIRAIVSDDPSVPAFYTDPDAVAYDNLPLEGAEVDNITILRSMRWTRTPPESGSNGSAPVAALDADEREGGQRGDFRPR